jgi:hypothetical protein
LRRPSSARSPGKGTLALALPEVRTERRLACFVSMPPEPTELREMMAFRYSANCFSVSTEVLRAHKAHQPSFQAIVSPMCPVRSGTYVTCRTETGTRVARLEGVKSVHDLLTGRWQGDFTYGITSTCPP